MNQFIDKRVTIGQKLAKYSNQNIIHGLYLYKDYVFSSMVGYMRQSATGGYYVQNKCPIRCFDIKVGNIVYGQVTKIRQDQAFVSLIQVQQTSSSKGIEGTIRKQHVRQKLIDQVVILQSFRPNDIIKARVISLGDSSRNLYLTTAGQDLGVAVAKNQNSGQLMLPYDWTSMIDVKTGQNQKRKVAKPQL